MSCSNQLAQLQRLARILKLHFRYHTLQEENNKDADQTAWMHRLVCVFVASMQPSGFLASRPIYEASRVIDITETYVASGYNEGMCIIKSKKIKK